MTEQEKVKNIEQEFRRMYEKGELQQLLQSDDLDVDMLKCLATIKDFYIQQQQKEIISQKDFKI
jgi:hypothetical protein